MADAKCEIAAKNFINSWKFKDDIECVFLTGSHASGNADEFSDIDLFIILNDDVKWRERGNKRVDGMLIEYFANPVRQVKKYIDECYSNVALTDVNMILSGIAIFDKNDTASMMVDFCKQKLASEFPKMSEFNVQTGLYFLWDKYDELNRAYFDQHFDFLMQFYNFVQHAFEIYSRYICSPVPGYQKLYRWLTDDDFAKKYGLATYNDLDFLKMMKMVFGCSNTIEIFELSKNIYEYVANKMGGLDIDNFVLHGPCE